MAKAQLRASRTFQLNDRVEMTQQGEQQLAGVRSKTGTVVGFGHHSTLYIVLDGYTVANRFLASLWRIIENVDDVK